MIAFTKGWFIVFTVALLVLGFAIGMSVAEFTNWEYWGQ